MVAAGRFLLAIIALAHVAAPAASQRSIFEVAPLRLIGGNATPDAPLTFVMANFGTVPYGSSVECAAPAFVALLKKRD